MQVLLTSRYRLEADRRRGPDVVPYSNLHWVCAVAEPAVLAKLVADDPEGVAAVLDEYASFLTKTGSQARPHAIGFDEYMPPFALLCHRNCEDATDEKAKACARLLAALPSFRPSEYCGGPIGDYSKTNLYWACLAGLLDLVQAWMEPARVRGTGPPVVLVLTSGNYPSHPGYHSECDYNGPSDLTRACMLGWPELVQHWITTDLAGVLACDECVTAPIDKDRKDYDSPFSAAGRAAGDVRNSEPRRGGARACARLLAALPHWSPTTVGDDDKTYAQWAEHAGVFVPGLAAAAGSVAPASQQICGSES